MRFYRTNFMKRAMMRKSIPTNIARELWAQCGGFCQNPICNRPLFAVIDETQVSLANVAHIIGHGADGPRSDHELAEAIDKDGKSNLIMLCLVCHKIVDELEKKFSVETMQAWKHKHSEKISQLFQIPNINDESILLRDVNDLLDINGTIFRECGPFSDSVLRGTSGDGLLLWYKRCLDTIIPNNERIVHLIGTNRRNFPDQWDVYFQMILFKVHVDAFLDNCLSKNKINDYKTFPSEFDHFIKHKLGIEVKTPLEDRDDEVTYRFGQLQTIIGRFLSTHQSMQEIKQVNLATMLVRLQDGRNLKVFVTCSYFFTVYTFDKVMEIDPSVDAIINSHPVGFYTDSAKQLCIDNHIGLFTLSEFMGAVRKQGEDFWNYLLVSESSTRLHSIKRVVKKSNPPSNVKVCVFGSYFRRKLYNDIDIMLIHSEHYNTNELKAFEALLKTNVENEIKASADITVSSSKEFAFLRFHHNNLREVYP